MRHIDSDTSIALLTGNRHVENRATFFYPRVTISSIVIAELTFGAYNSKRVDENLVRIQTLVNTFSTVPFDDLAADVYGKLRYNLQTRGRPMSTMDLLIASIAIAHNAILVTHNTKHFEHIEGLVLEDWFA